MLVPCKESQTGMFSKAGKFSVEMFTLLQEKDSLMSNKKKQYFVGVANFLEDKNLKRSAYVRSSESEDKMKKAQVEPFSKSTPRNYHSELQCKEM